MFRGQHAALAPCAFWRACLRGNRPGPPDEAEPARVAEAVEKMGLRYVVVTSVNRDDQPDGGAAIFARTITEIRQRVPAARLKC